MEEDFTDRLATHIMANLIMAKQIANLFEIARATGMTKEILLKIISEGWDKTQNNSKE